MSCICFETVLCMAIPRLRELAAPHAARRFAGGRMPGFASTAQRADACDHCALPFDEVVDGAFCLLPRV